MCFTFLNKITPKSDTGGSSVSNSQLLLWNTKHVAHTLSYLFVIWIYALFFSV